MVFILTLKQLLHVMMVAIANAFSNIARLPYCLNIPSHSFQLKLVRQGLTRKIDSNLSVFKWHCYWCYACACST